MKTVYIRDLYKNITKMRSAYRGPSPEAARRLPEITTVVFRIARDEVQESSGCLLLRAGR